jgi:hypothetical protein
MAWTHPGPGGQSGCGPATAHVGPDLSQDRLGCRGVYTWTAGEVRYLRRQRRHAFPNRPVEVGNLPVQQIDAFA